MCGRFTLKTPASEIASLFGVAEIPALEPRFNIAPTQPILAIRRLAGEERTAFFPRWGLVAPWAKDLASGAKTINARSETAAEKPTFRMALRRQRCLIPADGFYEWREVAKAKQPYFIHLASNQPFAFAGLWERWDRQSPAVESAAILTTSANSLMERLHDRMPVILPASAWGAWLDPAVKDPELLAPLLTQLPAELMALHPVSSRVNSYRPDDAGLIEPAEAWRQSALF